MALAVQAPDLQALAEALEHSRLGATMRGGHGAYAWANVAHLGGLVLLVGAIGVLDLRIAGFGRTIPLAPLSRLLTPIAVAGLVVLAASGFLLYAADAGPMTRAPTFRWKMALAAAGLVNAAAFRAAFGYLDRSGEPPPLAGAMSAASIALWLAVATLGRLIAYT